MGRPRILILSPGQRFGRLVVIDQPGVNNDWRCRCDCGAVRVVPAKSLMRGVTQSCGCLRREMTARKNTVHGMCGTAEYWTWRGMVGRCHNPREPSFHNYGGRGIQVCEEWRHDFQAFFADMGPKPSPSHSIDRIDNEKGYRPGNCRWTTNTVQMNNTRHNRRIAFRGETLTIAQWACRCALPYDVLLARLGRLGWSVQRALTTPLHGR